MQLWLNGSLVDSEHARISPLDRGLTRAEGVFETVRIYEGRPFAVTLHLNRLRASAARLGLQMKFTDQELKAGLDEVIDANAVDEGRVRITVTGGESLDGSRPTAIISASRLGDIPSVANVIVSLWPVNQRGPLVHVKSISYGERMFVHDWAQKKGATEAIWLNTDDELCEGTFSNIFVVKNGAVITPPLSSGCLEGVTRTIVLHTYDVLEEALRLEDLMEADEAFLTSSSRAVQPIAKVDFHQLPEAPGPITQKVAEAYLNFVGSNIDPDLLR